MLTWTMDPPRSFFVNQGGILSADDALACSPEEAAYWSLGGKAWGLARLVDQGFPVPPFFVVSNRVFWSSVPASNYLRWQNHALTDQDKNDIDTYIEQFHWGYTRHQLIQELLKDICPDGRPVAVRSSAVNEDSTTESYAGLYESHLCVPHDDVIKAIQSVWRSAFNESVQAYHQAKDRPFLLQIPSVVIQRVVQANVSGVAFSADPTTGQRGLAVVSAVHGLGSALVSGDAEAVTYHIGTKTSLPPFEPEYVLSCQRPTSSQTVYHRWGESGVTVESRPNGETDSDSPVNDALAKTVAALAWDCEAANHGVPQDVEWAIEADKLWVLQARPITAGETVDSDRRVDYTAWPFISHWVRDTAQETWPDPVKPSSLAFARRWVASTHQVLAQTACVPKVPESDYEWMYPALIGSVGSCLYQHQSLMDEFWRKAPSLTFTLKRCQAILGRWLPVCRLPKDSPYQVLYTGKGGLDSLGLLFHSAGWWLFKTGILWWKALDLPPRQHAFVTEMAQRQWEFESQPVTDLAAGVERLNTLDALWQDWQDVAALTNYWTTCLSDTLDRWYPNDNHHIPWRDAIPQNPSMMDSPSSVWMGRFPVHTFYEQWEASKHRVNHSLSPETQALLADSSVSDMACWEAIERDNAAAFWEDCQQFGLRCAGEMMIESAVLKDAPDEWVAQLRGVLAKQQAPFPPESTEPLPQRVPWYWRPLVTEAHRWLRVREYVRYAMSRWAHLYRLTVDDMGQILTEEGVLAESHQVHFLLFEELEALCVGLLSPSLAQQRIEARQAMYAMDTQPERQAQGPPREAYSFGRYVSPAMSPALSSASDEDVATRTQTVGQSVCAGRVEAPVLVWTHAALPPVEQCEGHILVVRQGSPALVGVYRHVKGLVFEVGSSLSHPAIVARELGVPTVVGVPKATLWLNTGDRVLLDGQTGVIQRLVKSGSTIE